MGAYNWINFEARCPACNHVAQFRAQTHIASDYDADETGRFHDRDYHLGDKMAWFPTEHKRFNDWREEWRGDCHDLPHEQAIEACYLDCPTCKAELYAVILFEDLRPIQVTDLGLESDWPVGLSK